MVRLRHAAWLFESEFLRVGDSLAQLAYLEGITLELSVSDTSLAHADILVDALRRATGGRVDVQVRTCDQAHMSAVQAKNGAMRSGNSALLSPLWCLKNHSKSWREW